MTESLLELSETGLERILDGPAIDTTGQAWRVGSIVLSHEGGVLVQVHPQGDARRGFHLNVRERDESRPAWKRTAYLDVIHQFPAGVEESALYPVAQVFVERLAALDDEEWTVVSPSPNPTGPLTSRVHRERPLPPEWIDSVPSPFDWGKVFVVTPAADCGQTCSFCSVRAGASPVEQAHRSTLQRYVEDLQRGRAEGYTRLRLSGFSPLMYPYALELLQAAKDAGYEELFVYSLGRKYADEAFLDAFLTTLPAKRLLFIPVYAATAEEHDKLVGVSGAFSEVNRGLENLAARGEMENVVLMTVLTRQTASELEGVQALAQRYGLPLQVFQPWPASRDPGDGFFQVALSHTDALAHLMRLSPPTGLPEILPCVRFRHEVESGQRALTDGGFRRNPALMATLYEFDLYRKASDGAGVNQHTTPVVDCPGSSECALSHLCPQEVYQAYSERFGLGELIPVSEGELAPLIRQAEEKA